MRSQEFQIQEGDCGDYWGVAGGSFEIPATPNSEQLLQFDPRGTVHVFNEKSPDGRRCVKHPDGEKPTGQWNRIDLYCLGDTSVHVVNGVTTMVLYKSRQLEGGQLLPLKRGKFQIQSEGSEIFFRDMKWQPIGEIPSDVLVAAK